MGSLRDYIQPWQFPLWMLLLAFWLAAVPVLLRWSMRKFQLADKRLTLGRSFVMTLLAGLSAAVTGLVVFLAMMKVFQLSRFTGPPRYYLSAAIAAGPMLVLALLVLWAMSDKPLKAIAKAAVVPAGAMGIVAAGIVLAIFLPAKAIRMSALAEQACKGNLLRIADYVKGVGDVTGVPPRTLDEGVAAGKLAAHNLGCPITGRAYFYHPVKMTSGQSNRAIVAGEAAGNHGEHRWILTSDGQLNWMTEAEFQAELALPQNASLAKKLSGASN